MTRVRRPQRLAWGVITALAAALLSGFWLQAAWDMAHPPRTVSPWGVLQADDPTPPREAP